MKLSNLIRRLIQWLKHPKRPIKDCWTLQEFIGTYGKIQVHVFTDSLGNKTIDRCRFIGEDSKQTEVYVAKVLQGYSREQLLENKDRLYRYKYRRTDGTHVLMRPSKLPMWLFEMEFRFLYYVNYPRIYWAGLTGMFNRKYKNR